MPVSQTPGLEARVAMVQGTPNPTLALPAGLPVLRFGELESTNKYTRKLAETGQLRGRAAVVVAERQTGGVGRFRRQWSSPAGGLWFTLAWPLGEGGPGDQVIDGLGLRVGLGCTRAIQSILGESKRPCDVRLKWPNDVMINGRKVAGVLCELVMERGAVATRRFVLIGVGVNANLSASQLPPELRDKSTGLLDHVAKPIPLDELLATLLRQLLDVVPMHGLSAETLNNVRGVLFGVGQPAAVSMPQGHKVHGVLLGVDQRGMAQLRTDDGIFTAPSGTVLMSDDDAAGSNGAARG